MWGEVARDVAFAAPRMLNSDVGKLREDFQHVLADEFGHAVRVIDKLVVLAAEEQAAVGAESVVVEDVAVVADWPIFGCRIRSLARLPRGSVAMIKVRLQWLFCSNTLNFGCKPA